MQRSCYRKPVRIALLALCLLLPVSLRAEEKTLTGKCIGISDGDTVKVLVGKTQVKVRLEGIDCPESHQDYGTKAKQFTAKLVFGKEVTVKVTDTDRYGRTIGRIYVDGKDVNLALVEAGLAWHYKAYSKEKALADAETAARAAGKGLWSQPNPTPPRLFRKGIRAYKIIIY